MSKKTRGATRPSGTTAKAEKTNVPTTPQIFGLAGQTKGKAVPIPTRKPAKKKPPKKTPVNRTPVIPDTPDVPDVPTGPTPYEQWLMDQEKQGREDAIEILTELYSQYGLESLVSVIVNLKNQGYSDEVINVRLQQTPEFQKRFAGNELRKKAGLPRLSPAEYISTEASYKKVMRDAMLPSGFYDDPDDFSKFIGFDISPMELQERVNMANLSLQNVDPFYANSLRSMYGLNEGDMLAYALDPERAMPLITRQVKSAQFGAEAKRQGLQVQKNMAETYVGLGITQDQARQGFEQVAQIAPEAEKLSAVFAGQEEAVSQEDVMSAVFTGEDSAKQKRKLQRLSQSNVDLFSGRSGIGRGSLERSQAGQI